MIFRLIILFLIIALVEFYSYQAFKAIFRVKWILIVYQIVSFAIIGFIVYGFTKFDRSVGQTPQTLFTLGLLLLILIPKIILTLVLFLEDIFRVFSGIYTHFVGNKEATSFLPQRRKFISQVALGLAAIPFGSLIYGMTKGKYNYKVITQQIFFPDLPDAFDGFKNHSNIRCSQRKF